MKKYLFLLVMATTFGFVSCADDDKPELPKLNRLTNVACTKNGQALYTVDITYDQSGQISRIVTDAYTDNYIYVGNTISINGVKAEGPSAGNSFIHTVFKLSSNVVSEKEEKAENPYLNNEVYTATLSTYTYSRNQMEAKSQRVQFPKTTGSGYEVRNLGKINDYTWENGNAIRFLNFPQQEISYEYNTQIRPANFPFRVVNTFAPIGFEVVSPVNFLYGNLNRNMVQRAYWYNLNNATAICAEYIFSYTMTADYITGMIIREKINPVDGVVAAENTYEYSFVYNSPQ